jgi:hypoxanthine phosphoribosyltransferase
VTAAPVLLDREAIDQRVRALGARIAADHPDGVVLVGVLKGASIFLADLVRAVSGVAVTVDFLAISRYAPESGRVRILKDLDVDVTGRAVVVVEDLVDTGLTLAYLLGHLRSRGPASLEACTLLDRADRRIVPVSPRYVGEELAGDAFVIGYGLHVGDRYRNLPMVLRADVEVLERDPDAYLPWYAPA